MYLIKVTYVAKEDNPNFAGQTQIWYSGKGTKSIEEQYLTQWWTENYGYSRLCDAKRSWELKNQGDELYWFKTCEVVEV